jgi:hypothetical protein
MNGERNTQRDEQMEGEINRRKLKSLRCVQR